MSDDTSLAFGHPAERARATAPRGVPLDRISLRDHITEADIGAFQSERGTVQRLRVNIVVEVARQSGIGDDVDRILSYDRLTEAVAAELAAERLNLLETLAARVADRILSEPQARRVFVRIEKLDRGPGALGVEIVRASDEVPQDGAVLQDTPHPTVVYLGNGAIRSERLGAWLTALDGPVILCVGPPPDQPPRSRTALAQRRIDLLAIAQNAWVLAGRDRRCIVVESRAELDWGLRHGQISVWSPVKIVLDASDAPGSLDGPALTAWFADLMEARELIVIDAPLPRASVPVRGASL